MQTIPDLRTDRQRLKDKRHAAVVRDFKSVRETLPEAKLSRVIAMLGGRHNYTNSAVRYILKDAQLI